MTNACQNEGEMPIPWLLSPARAGSHSGSAEGPTSILIAEQTPPPLQMPAAHFQNSLPGMPTLWWAPCASKGCIWPTHQPWRWRLPLCAHFIDGVCRAPCPAGPVQGVRWPHGCVCVYVCVCLSVPVSIVFLCSPPIYALLLDVLKTSI